MPPIFKSKHSRSGFEIFRYHVFWTLLFIEKFLPYFKRSCCFLKIINKNRHKMACEHVNRGLRRTMSISAGGSNRWAKKVTIWATFDHSPVENSRPGQTELRTSSDDVPIECSYLSLGPAATSCHSWLQRLRCDSSSQTVLAFFCSFRIKSYWQGSNHFTIISSQVDIFELFGTKYILHLYCLN